MSPPLTVMTPPFSHPPQPLLLLRLTAASLAPQVASFRSTAERLEAENGELRDAERKRVLEEQLSRDLDSDSKTQPVLRRASRGARERAVRAALNARLLRVRRQREHEIGRLRRALEKSNTQRDLAEDRHAELLEEFKVLEEEKIAAEAAAEAVAAALAEAGEGEGGKA